VELRFAVLSGQRAGTCHVPPTHPSLPAANAVPPQSLSALRAPGPAQGVHVLALALSGAWGREITMTEQHQTLYSVPVILLEVSKAPQVRLGTSLLSHL